MDEKKRFLAYSYRVTYQRAPEYLGETDALIGNAREEGGLALS